MTEPTNQLEGLTPISNWQSIANGIWTCEIGDMGKEQRYTDLAAEPPRLEAIDALSPADFPITAKFGCPFCNYLMLILVQ